MAPRYDVTLKALLRDSAGRAVYTATGLSIETWLDVELPKVANSRLDLLGETHDGSLLHLELQVSNDAEPQRMAEYALGIYRIYRKFARQIVLYAGEPDLRMATSLEGPRFAFSFEIIDLRDLDGEMLLASDNVGDNVLAILTRLRDQRSAIDEILRKIATLDASKREQAIEAFAREAVRRHSAMGGGAAQPPRGRRPGSTQCPDLRRRQPRATASVGPVPNGS